MGYNMFFPEGESLQSVHDEPLCLSGGLVSCCCSSTVLEDYSGSFKVPRKGHQDRSQGAGLCEKR